MDGSSSVVDIPKEEPIQEESKTSPCKKIGVITFLALGMIIFVGALIAINIPFTDKISKTLQNVLKVLAGIIFFLTLIPLWLFAVGCFRCCCD